MSADKQILTFRHAHSVDSEVYDYVKSLEAQRDGLIKEIKRISNHVVGGTAMKLMLDKLIAVVEDK